MKILAMTDLSGHMVGGPTTAAVELLNGLTQRGHHVVLVNDHPYPGLVGVEHASHSITDARATAEEVRRLLSHHRPDVVHLLSMGQKPLRRLAGLLKGRPWLMTLHSISPYERIVRGWHRYQAIHYALRNLRYLPNTCGWHALLRTLTIPRVIVHSRWMEGVGRRYGVAANSLRVVELACAPAPMPTLPPFAPNPLRRGPQIVTVAGIAHTKGLHDAIRAIAKLRPSFPGIGYIIIGEVRDPTYLRFIKSLTIELALEDVVEVRERIPTSEKDRLLEGADVYIQSSHEEGFCLAYLEAAHRVARLVGTSTGAISEISGGDVGIKVTAPGDVDALAAAIEALLRSSKPSAAQFATRQNRLGDQFSWDRHVDDHESIYSELVRGV